MMPILGLFFLTLFGFAIYFLFKYFFKYFDARMNQRIEGRQEHEPPDAEVKC